MATTKKTKPVAKARKATAPRAKKPAVSSRRSQSSPSGQLDGTTAIVALFAALSIVFAIIAFAKYH